MSRARDAASTPGQAGEVAIFNPLVAEIAEVLLDLGGMAHRDLVAAHVARRRGDPRPSEALKQALGEAFETYCQGADDPRAASLLHLPHGPGSQRWALTDWAHGLLRARAAPRAP